MRHHCPALANKTYFNYGGQGPLPTPTLEAITSSWQRIQELGPFTADVWPYISREVNSTRALLAGLCGVAPHRLALSENVTSGCVLPLWGLPLAPGDRILISDCEHPGVVAACHELARRQQLQIDTLTVQQLRGGREEQAQTDAAVLQALETHLQPRTRLVVLSHLLWNTGQRMPIAAVAAQLRQHPRRQIADLHRTCAHIKALRDREIERRLWDNVHLWRAVGLQRLKLARRRTAHERQ